MEPKCRLLGPFSLLIQSILGLLSLSSLVLKRYREYPNRRPWKVWLFDVSKQVIGTLMVHIMNVGMSILNSNNDFDDNYLTLQSTSSVYTATPDNDNDDSNPCEWYFLNILFDTTIGVFILWWFLYAIYNLAHRAGISEIESGQYGNPPRYSAYSKQLSLYFVGLLCMKLVIYIALVLIPGLEPFTEWLLSWSDPYPKLQVFFVILLFPLMMNTLQYILIDNIIQSPEYKHKTESSDEHIEGLLGQQEPELSESEHPSHPPRRGSI